MPLIDELRYAVQTAKDDGHTQLSDLIGEAADEIEQLRRNLNGRDDFLVNKGLWQEFVDDLPRQSRPLEASRQS